jgi:hypothetical protein
MPSPSNKNSSRDILRYAGLASQIVASLGIAVFAGIKLDHWARLSFPVFSCLLPLLVIVGLMAGLMKESSKKNDK